jgi:phytoene dehydrogenase-like protein
MLMMVPSVWDETLAPPGHHTMSIWMQYAPVRLAESSWAQKSEEMTERIIDSISTYSAGFRDKIVDRLLLTPADLDDRVLLTDGNIHHIDIVPSQMLWARPCPELARYRTPVDGLYLCGAGQHPYGEITGAPGHNAAHAVLEDLELVSSQWQELRDVTAA